MYGNFLPKAIDGTDEEQLFEPDNSLWQVLETISAAGQTG